jgi:hypothetical protein
VFSVYNIDRQKHLHTLLAGNFQTDFPAAVAVI